MAAPAVIDLAALRRAVAGDVIAPADAGYDGARAVWNASIDRRPAAILRCRGTADVVAGLAFARAHELRVSVRGGGHNVAGSRSATAGSCSTSPGCAAPRWTSRPGSPRSLPGSVWGDVDAATQAHRPGDAGWARLLNRRRRLHARRRDRLARAPLRPRLRQPRGRGGRDRRRRGRERRRGPGPALGPARRGRELRRRHRASTCACMRSGRTCSPGRSRSDWTGCRPCWTSCASSSPPTATSWRPC